MLVLAGVIWALYRAAKELFEAAERILSAFASLLGVLVRTLPSVVLAGVIALGGVWFMNHLDNKPLHLPVAYNPFTTSANPPSAGSPAPASGNATPAPSSSTASPAPAASGTSAPAAEHEQSSPAGR